MSVESLQTLLDAGVAEGIFPSAQAVILHRGQTVFAGGAGASTPPTRYDLASLTKVMGTTAAFLALWAQGKVGPQAKVARFLPETELARAGVTLADLLFHRSGLPAGQPFFAAAMRAVPELRGPDCPASAREEVRREVVTAAAHTRLERHPGEAAVYSDIGFILLGEILASIADRPLDQLVKERVFDPLGLAVRYHRLTAFPADAEQSAPTGKTRPREPAPGQEHRWPFVGLPKVDGAPAPAASRAPAPAPIHPERRSVGPQSRDARHREQIAEGGGPISAQSLGNERPWTALGLNGEESSPVEHEHEQQHRCLPVHASTALGLNGGSNLVDQGREGSFSSSAGIDFLPTRPGEVDDDNAWVMDGVAGHAGLFGTASDVSRFGQSILDGLSGQSPLAPAPLWQLLLTRDTSTPGSTRTLGFDTPGDAPSSGRWIGNRPPGAVGHLGFTGTSLWVDLSRELVVVLLTNRVNLGRAEIRIRDFRPRFHDAAIQATGLAG